MPDEFSFDSIFTVAVCLSCASMYVCYTSIQTVPYDIQCSKCNSATKLIFEAVDYETYLVALEDGAVWVKNELN